MNGLTKLSVAIALALVGGSNAFALGLGAIQVKSGLNQPLNAEIAVIADSPAEATGLSVSLAKAEDFQRVGLDRARLSIPIDFEVITSGRQPVIHLTTKDPVREPFLDFLVEANWAKGRVLREYTVLLDPPVMAPALKGSSATVAPIHEAAPAPSTRLETPAPKPVKAPKVKPPRSEVAEAKPTPPPKAPPAPKPAPAPATAARAPSSGEYGPVAQGETLSEIARATKDDSTDTNAMMLALLQANPNAFYKDNINALKRGAILRIPSHDDVKSAGNAAAAAAAVRDQNQAWSSGNVPVAKPTLVATTGQPKTAPPAPVTKPTSSKPNDALALVPPASGKGGQSTADKPGSASGTGSTTSGARGDLQRTKESLASREQEVGELKSRVKELEDINSKDQKLLTLRNSELADLQAKLKELESKSASAASKTPTPTPSSTTPSATPATTPSNVATTPATTKPDNTKITAQDIWGKISDSDKTKSSTTPATTPSTSPSTTPSTASTTTPPATTSSTTSSATPSSSTSPATSTAMTGPTPSTTTAAASTTPSTSSTSTTSPLSSTPTTTTSTPGSTSSTTPATTSTSATTSVPPSTSPTATVTPVVTPATSTPAVLKPKPAVAPTPPPEQAWYENTMTLAIAGGALLLVGLLALMRFMRRPKPVVLNETDGDVLIEEPHQYSEMPVESEAELLDALAQHPGDPELSLKLLRMYYAERDAGKFEAAAEAMYAHIADPTQPEWQEVKAMGEDLVPHNPLFGGNDSLAGYMHESVAPVAHSEEAHLSDDNFDLGGFDADGTPASEESFDFDLADHTAKPAPVVVAPVVAAPVVAETLVPASKSADDFFAGEDTIGTKLDLARAYLDMGDPEGARSMLDEVMTEGNESQKGEARKLLAEIK